MSQTALTSHLVTRTAAENVSRAAILLALAVSLFSLALLARDHMLGVIFLSGGLTLMALMGLVWIFARRHRQAQDSALRTIEGFVEHDASPSFVTDADGRVTYRNKAAQDRVEGEQKETLAGSLAGLFANPSAILFRLQNRAQAVGSARDDVVTRRGHVRLSVHKVGVEGYLWRIEDIGDRTPNSRGAEGLSLPMLTVSKAGTILFMNDAMRRLLGGRVKTLDRIFNNLPIRPGAMNTIAAAEGPVETLVAEVEGANGRREVYLLPGTTLPDASNASWKFFEELPVPLLKIARGGTVTLSNKLSRDLLMDQMVKGVLLSDLLEGLGRSVDDWLADALDGRALGHPEVLRAKKTDADVFLQISLGRIQEEDGPALVAVLNDATELKTLEAQFVQSQKMQAIGQLAGGVAHDFNNLLTAISGHCDLLLLRHDQGDPEYGDLVQIHQNANRAASLVGQLLAFSRKQTLQPEILDLRDTMSDLTHLLNRLVGEKISLSLSHDPELHPIRADKRQLEQVLMNLVVNARDAMRDGGEIRIETKNTVLETPYKRDRAEVPPGRYILVTVSDQGVGIPPEKLPKIFEPFFTTKRTGEGTGLGLSTAYGIVKQSGGFIFVDSTPDEGTVFSLYFPANDRPVEPLQPAIPRSARRMTGQGEGVVLLVEDEAPVRAFASRALRLGGYTVLEAENAEDALKTLEDPALAIDIFVTDVIMPGMDGPTWVKEALRDRPDVKVVFVSGYAEDAFDGSQDRIPNSVFLPKPFSLNDLTATVQEQLH